MRSRDRVQGQIQTSDHLASQEAISEGQDQGQGQEGTRPGIDIPVAHPQCSASGARRKGSASSSSRRRHKPLLLALFGFGFGFLAQQLLSGKVTDLGLSQPNA